MAELEDVIIYIDAINNRYKIPWRNLVVKKIERKFSMNGSASKVVTVFEQEGIIEYVGDLFEVERNRLGRRMHITKKGEELFANAVIIRKLLANTNRSCSCKIGTLCSNCVANHQIAGKTRKINTLLAKQYEVKNGKEGKFMSKMIVG